MTPRSVVDMGMDLLRSQGLLDDEIDETAAEEAVEPPDQLDLLADIAAQIASTRTELGMLTSTVSMLIGVIIELGRPRVKQPVRDESGRITHVIDAPAPIEPHYGP